MHDDRVLIAENQIPSFPQLYDFRKRKSSNPGCFDVST